QTYLTGWVGERILADLRNKLFRHLQRLSLGFYERTRGGVIISRLTNDVEALDQLVTDGVASLVQNSLTLVGTAILLFVLDWRLGLAALAVLPAMAVATAIFRARTSRAYRAVREPLRPGTATLAGAIAGVPLGRGRARQDHGRARRGAGRSRPLRRPRARPHRGPRPLRGRPLRLRRRAGGPARDRPGRARRDDRCARRAHRRRQVDDREAD